MDDHSSSVVQSISQNLLNVLGGKQEITRLRNEDLSSFCLDLREATRPSVPTILRDIIRISDTQHYL